MFDSSQIQIYLRYKDTQHGSISLTFVYLRNSYENVYEKTLVKRSLSVEMCIQKFTQFLRIRTLVKRYPDENIFLRKYMML